MYKYSDNILAGRLSATTLVGAMAAALENHDILVELDSDKFTTYSVMADHEYVILAPSMMDAEMYVSHVLMEFVSAIWEMEENEAQTVHKSMTFTFSAKELLEAFRD